MRSALPDHFGSDIARIKQESALPVAAGFGISSRETAQAAIAAALSSAAERIEAITKKLNQTTSSSVALG